MTDNRPSPRWFAVRFLVLLAAGNVLMMLPAVDAGLLVPWTKLNAAWSAKLATLAGLPAAVDGTVLVAGTAAIDVKAGCNGVHALLIFASAVLASPAPWLRRLAGVLLGGVVILGFNIVRLVNLLAIARFAPDRLELFHIYIWQTLIVILALATFVAWGLLIARDRDGKPRIAG